MKTIVFCDQYGQLGGGQQVLLELVSAALANSLAVKVLLPAGPCADQLEAAGAEVRRIPACTLTQGRKKFADILYGTAYCLNVFLRNIAFLRSAELIACCLLPCWHRAFWANQPSAMCILITEIWKKDCSVYFSSGSVPGLSWFHPRLFSGNLCVSTAFLLHQRSVW